MAAAEKAMVIGFHFNFPSMGYVEKDGANLPPDPGGLESGSLNAQGGTS